MLENELKNLWQNGAENVKFNAERLANTYLLEKKIEKFDKSIFWRNFIEYTASVIVIIFTVYQILYVKQSLLQNLANYFAILACVFISYLLYKTRDEKLKINASLSILEELQLLKAYYEKEKKFLENIAVNYLLPFVPSMVMTNIHFYFNASQTFFIWYLSSTIVLFLVIWIINIYVAKRKYIPILEGLANQIKEWE